MRVISAGQTAVYPPRGDGGHGGVLVAVPHSEVVSDLPRCDERRPVISQQPLVI